VRHSPVGRPYRRAARRDLDPVALAFLAERNVFGQPAIGVDPAAPCPAQFGVAVRLALQPQMYR